MMATFDDFTQELHDEPLDTATRHQHADYFRTLESPVAAAPAERPKVRKPRVSLIVGLIAGAIVAAGGGTAAAFALFAPATDTATGYCFSSESLDESMTNRIEFAAAGSAARPEDASAVAVEVCAVYWRSGVFGGGSADPVQLPVGGTSPVPPLAACVLPSGKAGVFPGGDSACEALGLVDLKP